MSKEDAQYSEFMKELKYAFSCVKNKKYNLKQYYEHMADFFDYIELPRDAQEHRVLAKKWKIKKRGT
tara:strand:+ start:1376 stop:1576 length:201 start_codon:yes stop_codon:yes gene_type:complete